MQTETTTDLQLEISYPVLDNCVLNNEINSTYFQLRNSGHFLILAEIYLMEGISMSKLRADLIELNTKLENFYHAHIANNPLYDPSNRPSHDIRQNLENIFLESALNQTLAGISNSDIAELLYNGKPAITNLTAFGTYLKKNRPSEAYISWKASLKDNINLIPGIIHTKDRSINENTQLDPIPAQLLINSIIDRVKYNPIQYNSELQPVHTPGFSETINEIINNFHMFYWKAFYEQRGRLSAVPVTLKSILLGPEYAASDWATTARFFDRSLTWSRLPGLTQMYSMLTTACESACNELLDRPSVEVLESVYTLHSFAKIGFPVEGVQEINCVPTSFVELREVI